MATVSKSYSFDAAHQLPNHFGKCANLHGHTYTVEVTFSGYLIPGDGQSGQGMVIDYYDFDVLMKPLIEEYCDHKFLNDTLPVKQTTAELIACWFCQQLDKQGFPIERVVVKETPKTAATVTPTDVMDAIRKGLLPDE